jgi:hypothetical protein
LLTPESAQIATPVFSSPNAFLTLKEEEDVLQWIEKRQNQGDCASPKEIRWRASDLRKKRVDDDRIPTRHWWHSFKKRYESRLKTKIATSTEGARSEVMADETRQYYDDVEEALSDIVDPTQVINVDESGASSRPNKGKRKRIVYSPLIPKIPTFKEERDVTHVSIVAGVSLSGETLRPMYLTVTEVKDKSEMAHDLLQSSEIFKTTKGYQTGESMSHYILTILAPYCEKVRTRLNNPDAPIFLIMDNCESHRMPFLLDMYAQLNVKVIWLPAHRSHFLQTLDVGIFSKVKAAYLQLRRIPTTPAVVGKLHRLAEAWHIGTARQAVNKAWETAGFKSVWGTSGAQVVIRYQVDRDKVEELIKKNCPSVQKEAAAP